MDDSVACKDVIVVESGSRSHFIYIRNNLATNWLPDKITNTARMKNREGRYLKFVDSKVVELTKC